jgi:hypothetical protein
MSRWFNSKPTIGRADFVLAVGVAFCLRSHVGGAQDAPAKVTIEVGDCVGLTSPDERLACFDRHVEAAKPSRDANPAVAPPANAVPTPSPPHADAVASAASPATAPAPPPAAAAAAQASAPAVAAAAAATAVTAPSQAAPIAAASAAPAPSSSTSAPSASAENATRNNPSEHDADAKPEVVATVTELHETVPNAWLITLDNGQVWRQNPPQRFALTAGQRVTLRGTKWGTSYRLSAETLSGFIQVERVR